MPFVSDDPCEQRRCCCNPPAYTAAEIVSVEHVGSGTRILIDAGADDGVDVGWVGEFVSPKSKGHEEDFVIEKVTQHSSYAKVTLTLDEVNVRCCDVRLQRPD